jgi:hypothetical protein
MEDNWKGYITAIGGSKAPASNIDQGMPFSNTEGGVSSGFVEWKPNNKEVQARYDAMNTSWEGVEASENAASTNIFKHSFMPVNHK